MTESIRKYLVTPSPLFETTTELNQKPCTIQKFAITRLAQCIKNKQFNPNDPDDNITSTCNSIFYALLNEMTRFTDEFGAIKSPVAEDTKQVEAKGQQICVNALSTIVGIAVYLEEETVSIRI